jgi:hypothetical protein
MSCWLAGSGVGFRIRAGWGCKVRGRQTLVVRAPRPPPPTLRSMGLGNSHATKTECFLAAQPSAVFRSKIRVVVEPDRGSSYFFSARSGTRRLLLISDQRPPDEMGHCEMFEAYFAFFWALQHLENICQGRPPSSARLLTAPRRLGSFLPFGF